MLAEEELISTADWIVPSWPVTEPQLVRGWRSAHSILAVGEGECLVLTPIVERSSTASGYSCANATPSVKCTGMGERDYRASGSVVRTRFLWCNGDEHLIKEHKFEM
eukprot:IDg8920t1